MRNISNRLNEQAPRRLFLISPVGPGSNPINCSAPERGTIAQSLSVRDCGTDGAAAFWTTLFSDADGLLDDRTVVDLFIGPRSQARSAPKPSRFPDGVAVRASSYRPADLSDRHEGRVQTWPSRVRRGRPLPTEGRQPGSPLAPMSARSEDERGPRLCRGHRRLALLLRASRSSPRDHLPVCLGRLQTAQRGSQGHLSRDQVLQVQPRQFPGSTPPSREWRRQGRRQSSGNSAPAVPRCDLHFESLGEIADIVDEILPAPKRPPCRRCARLRNFGRIVTPKVSKLGGTRISRSVPYVRRVAASAPVISPDMILADH